MLVQVLCALCLCVPGALRFAPHKSALRSVLAPLSHSSPAWPGVACQGWSQSSANQSHTLHHCSLYAFTIFHPIPCFKLVSPACVMHMGGGYHVGTVTCRTAHMGSHGPAAPQPHVAPQCMPPCRFESRATLCAVCKYAYVFPFDSAPVWCCGRCTGLCTLHGICHTDRHMHHLPRLLTGHRPHIITQTGAHGSQWQRRSQATLKHAFLVLVRPILCQCSMRD